MSPVFGHGRLRLYLLKLLEESPRHGYEVIRLLQDRFLGVYSPSPGTIYPRLTRLEEEGLVTHEVVSGKKVYAITDAGRAELERRMDELAELEQEITQSVRDIAREVQEDVRSTVRSLREELTQAARDVRRGAQESAAQERRRARDEWREARDRQKAEFRSQKEFWKEQTRAWKDEWKHTWEDAWTHATGSPADGAQAKFNRVLRRFVDDVQHEARDAEPTAGQLEAAAGLLAETKQRLVEILLTDDEG